MNKVAEPIAAARTGSDRVYNSPELCARPCEEENVVCMEIPFTLITALLMSFGQAVTDAGPTDGHSPC